MASEDTSVDVSVLDELIELRRQQALIDQFCARADEMKDKVEQAVYSRVLADYGARRQGLEAQAAPLVTRALAEYRKLRAVHDRVKRTNDEAQLDKDEIEFRHSLGEIDESVRKERLVAPERVLAESSARLEMLDGDDARFREALPDVDLSAEEPVADASAAHATEAVAVAQSSGEATITASALGADETGPSSGVGEWVDVGGSAPEGGEDNTVAATDAVLVSEGDNGQAVHYALSGSTYIGRAEDNQLRILDPGISRRHVLIAAADGVYTIRDLKSQNGTYVNGERIDEVALADGDRITIGEMNLIFRAPLAAPAASHAS